MWTIRYVCLLPQGLLKVAIDNARAQEKQVQLEKTELKMELFRERELRETLEKQLAVEQKNRGVYQRHANPTQHTIHCVSNSLFSSSSVVFFSSLFSRNKYVKPISKAKLQSWLLITGILKHALLHNSAR